MCIDPGSIAIISTLASVVGTAVGGMAQVQAQKAQEQQSRNNAIIAQRNATDARQRGVVAEQDVQLRNRAMIGKQKNTLSERNISLASGSALDIIGDTAMFGKLDALTTRGNFEREAIGHESQMMNFNAQAEQSRMASRATMFGTGINLFSTALGGVSDYRKATAPMRL
jgi:type II secretory pathway pseudopilin PulG